ncbi:MAG: hypothetical protein K9K64_04855 [Desulfohalobiaceae bacterium]|nr:hypothetical protein [Desulfohalobiaceae bacterium]
MGRPGRCYGCHSRCKSLSKVTLLDENLIRGQIYRQFEKGFPVSDPNAVGDGVGVAGSKAAMEEGRIAGTSMAWALGRGSRAFAEKTLKQSGKLLDLGQRRGPAARA